MVKVISGQGSFRYAGRVLKAGKARDYKVIPKEGQKQLKASQSRRSPGVRDEG